MADPSVPNNELQEIQDETLSTLLDACVNAHVITSQIQDGGRLLRKIRQLKVTINKVLRLFMAFGSRIRIFQKKMTFSAPALSQRILNVLLQIYMMHWLHWMKKLNRNLICLLI
jgi:hypothetical protein